MALALLVFSIWTGSCISLVKPAQINMQVSLEKNWQENNVLVLVDDDYPIYQRIIVGIHTQSQGHYGIIKVDDHGIRRAALFERLVSLSPKGVIALGPRSSLSLIESQVFLPSAITMVPRLINYDFDLDGPKIIGMKAGLKERIEILSKVFPNVKKVALIFSKQYSRQAILYITNIFEKAKITVKEIESQSKDEILLQLNSYKEDYDALFMEEDPILLDNKILHKVIKFLQTQKKPIFALDCSIVEKGATIGFGLDYFGLGQQLYDIIENINSENIYENTEVIDPKNLTICLNLNSIKNINVDINFFHALFNYIASKNFALNIF